MEFLYWLSTSLFALLFPVIFLYIFYRVALRLGSSSIRSARKAHYRAFKS